MKRLKIGEPDMGRLVVDKPSYLHQQAFITVQGKGRKIDGVFIGACGISVDNNLNAVAFAQNRCEQRQAV
ncbi:hypothetical protein Bwad005_08890 [Bilophila wadsworthia]